MMNTEIEKLNGTIEEITHYYEEKDGFTVMEVSSDGDDITVVGNFPRLVCGEQVELEGYWSFHPIFGRQVHAEWINHSLRQDTDGIFQYLSSGIIFGLGQSTAIKIIKKFGADTFDVIENDVDRLASVEKIGKQKAEKIHKEFMEQAVSRDVLIALSKIGLNKNESMKAYKLYGANAFDIIDGDPYIFANDLGYSFERAEEIAPNVSNNDLKESRNKAGVVYTVKRNLSNGHTCLPRDLVISHAKDYLECSDDDVEIAADNAIESHMLVSDIVNDKEFLFLPEVYEAEHSAAERISMMSAYPPEQIDVFDEEISSFESVNKILFDEEQRQAIEIAVNKGLLILTGGPGTGKTTTVKAMITLMKSKGLKVVLTAPTGRAAKRMTELTGFEAKTIHRLLEAQKNGDSEFPKFNYNRRNLLEIDAVIVDELSMVDIVLFNSLLDAMPLSARLIMVGDKNQLPPVGAGNVLSDLIESGKIPVVELEKIFRQAQKSLIVTNAHKVVSGEMPDISNENQESDFFFMKEYSKDKCCKDIVDLVKIRLPNKYGLNSLNDIQVLCPSRKGLLGSENFNILLQNAINPAANGKKELPRKGFVFREGDKVMQIKNNYDIELKKGKDSTAGVFNGDIGIIKKIERPAGILLIDFDSGEALYPIDSAYELELAYAMTVHKSQGSEFEAVVMPMLSLPPQLIYRNLFYTAITRAKHLLVLAGSEKVISSMVRNDRKSKRYSALKAFLNEN